MPEFDSFNGFAVRFLLILLGIFISFLIPWALAIAFAQIGVAQGPDGKPPTFWQRIWAKIKAAVSLYAPLAGAGAVIALTLTILIYAGSCGDTKILGNIKAHEACASIWISLGIFWDLLWSKIVRSIKDHKI